MSRVHLSPCRSYDETAVAKAVRECFAAFPGIGDRLTRGTRVLLKPNIINARPPESAVCTHPAVVRAVADVCCDAGCDVMIADEPGYALVADPASLFRETGYLDACAGLPVTFELLKRGGYREVQIARPLSLDRILFSELVLDADLVINLPKLKTHQMALLTCAIKNMFGGLAPRERIRAHLVGSFEKFGDAVADIFSARVPELSVLDAVVGMEGKGPSRGTPIDVGLILAAEDAVALDAIAADLAGFAPDEVRTTLSAHARGLGQRDLSSIDVTGANPADFRKSFERAPGGIRRGFPPWVGALIRRLVWVRPKVVPTNCVRCGACARVCPGEAITIDTHARIDYDQCIECFCCEEVCPADAVDLQWSFLARRIIGGSRGNKGAAECPCAPGDD